MSRRMSSRSYTSQSVSNQQLLEVLWAAYGYIDSSRTVPRIGANYPLIIFSVNETGSYKYVPESNALAVHDLTVKKQTISGDFGPNTWVDSANVVLVVVWDQSVSSNQYFASAQAGCLVQNVYLVAASLDLGTCCVGIVNSEGLRNHLKLASNYTPLFVMPLSYPSSPYPSASPNYAFMTGNLPPVQYSQLTFKDALKNMLIAQNWPAQNLNTQQLSQLLWAAYGYTSVAHGTSYHRTTPSAYGIYPLVVFISNATGVYRYLPETHSVTAILQGDKRSEIANALPGQQWASSAPALFLIAYDSAYNNGNTGDGGAVSHMNIEVNAGAVIQQLLLESSARNLSANVIYEGLEDWNGAQAATIRDITGLSSAIIPLYVVPVGPRALDATPPVISNLSQNPAPASVEPNQKVTVTVSVVDEGGILQVILSYSLNESQTWTNITMNYVSGNNYAGEIPGFEAGTRVRYKIIAYDNANNSAIEDNNRNYHIYTVIPEFHTVPLLLLMIFTLLAVILAKTRKGSFLFKRVKINVE